MLSWGCHEGVWGNVGRKRPFNRIWTESSTGGDGRMQTGRYCCGGVVLYSAVGLAMLAAPQAPGLLAPHPACGGGGSSGGLDAAPPVNFSHSPTFLAGKRPSVPAVCLVMAAVSLVGVQIKLCSPALQFVYLKEAFSPSLDEKISVLVQARCSTLSCSSCIAVCCCLLSEEQAGGPACAKRCIAAPVPCWRAAALL